MTTAELPLYAAWVEHVHHHLNAW